MNTYSVTLKKIKNNVGLELRVNEKKLVYFDEHPIDGIKVLNFGDKEVVEIDTNIIKKAIVHIFTSELHTNMQCAGDSVIEIRNGNMLLDRTRLDKLGFGYGYRVFKINNDEFNISTVEYR